MARVQRTSSSFSSQKQRVSLDIGSSTTRVKINDKIAFDEPTCLALRRGSDSVVAYGKKAYQLLGKNTSQLEVTFPVQYGAVAHTTHFEFLMQSLGNQLFSSRSWMSQFFGAEVDLALPDSLSPVEKSQFIKGVEAGTFGKLKPVSAGIAAARSLQRLHADGAPVCLVHIGGQTTQISVLSAGSVATSATFHVGGTLFTEAVQETIRNKEHCGVSWHLAEMIKKEIAYIDSSILSRSIKQKKMSVQGKDITTQLGKTVVVAAEDFVPAFAVVLSDLLLSIRLFFAQLPTDLATTTIASGLVLTGGSSAFTGLAEYLSAELETEVFASPNPEYDVINGTQPSLE